MKHQELKGMVKGFLLAVLVMSLAVSAMAAAKTISVTSGTKLTINGAAFVPKDANGKEVEVFAYNGTTYVPIRAIGEAFNKNVTWVGETSTVAITNKSINAVNGTVLLDKDGIRVTCTGIEAGTSYAGGQEVKLLIENSSAKNFTIQTRNFSVNDYMVSPVFSCNVGAGKKANDRILISQAELDKNGITNVETLEFILAVVNSDSLTDSYNSDKITIKAK